MSTVSDVVQRAQERASRRLLQLITRPVLLLTSLFLIFSPLKAQDGSPQINLATPASTVRPESRTGEIRHRLRIQIPPGPRGTVPDLVIASSHRATDGILGKGWILEGLGRIDRLGASRGVPRFDGTDRYELDGTSLHRIDEEGLVFGPQRDDNRRLIYIEEEDYWVAGRDGWKWYYGEHSRRGELVGENATERQSDTGLCDLPTIEARKLVAVEPGRFRRGDVNDDENVDITDAVDIIGILFLRAAPPRCHKAADVNDNGEIEIGDALRLLLHRFRGAARPPAPFNRCSLDPTPDDLPCGETERCAENTPATPEESESTAWLLSRAVDPSGNEYTVDYRQDCDIASPLIDEFPGTGYRLFGGHYAFRHIPERIRYAGRRIEVDFEYENRPDPITDARSGLLRRLKKRLSAIRIWVDAASANPTADIGYEFRYRDSLEEGDLCEQDYWIVDEETLTAYNPVENENLSILVRIDQLGLDGSRRTLRCMRTDGSETTFDTEGEEIDLEIDRETTAHVPMVVNFDGDSYPDLFLFHVEPGGLGYPLYFTDFEVFSNTDDGTASLAADPDLAAFLDAAFPGPWLEGKDAKRRAWLFIDLDRDGATEVVTVDETSSDTCSEDACGLVYEYFKGAAEHPVREGWIHLSADLLQRARSADIDGDGFLDLIIPPNFENLGTETTWWIRNRGEAPYLHRDDLEELSLPLERADGTARRDLESLREECSKLDFPPIYPFYQPGSCGGSREYQIESEFISDRSLYFDVNGDGVSDVLTAVYPCWYQEGTEVGPYYPDRSVPAYTRVFLGDGNGTFHDSGLSAGPPISHPLSPSSVLEAQRERLKEILVDACSLPEGFYESIAVPWVSRGTLGIGNFDGSGRVQLIHRHHPTGPPVPKPKGVVVVNPRPGELVSSRYQGTELGFGFGPDPTGDWSGDNETGALETVLPVSYLSDPAFDALYNLVADWDGDGLDDVLSVQNYNPYSESGPDDFEVRLYRNERQLPYGRLSGVRLPTGGEISWSYVPTTELELGNKLPVVLDVVSEVRGPDGPTTYNYEGSRFKDGEFLGFRDVVATRASGRSTHWRYTYREELRGAPVYRCERRADGTIEYLTAFSYLDWSGIDGDTADVFDSEAPYFNPPLKRCDFWLGHGHETPSGNTQSVDIDDLIEECHEWDSLGQLAMDFDEFFRALDWDSELLDIVPDRAEKGLVVEHDPTVHRTPFTPPIYLPETGEVYPGIEGNIPTGLIDAGTRAPRRPEGQNPTPYIFAVTEYQFDADQRLSALVDHGDVSTTRDDLRTDRVYEEIDKSERGKRLISVIESNASGETLLERHYSNFFAFDRPGQVVEAAGGQTRELAIEFGSRGLSTRITDPDGVRQDISRNSLGQILSHTDAAGRTLQRQYDAAGRLVLVSFQGATLAIERDAFGRIDRRELDPGGPSAVQAVDVLREDTFHEEDTGSERIALIYSDGTTRVEVWDGWGRMIREVRGRIATGTAPVRPSDVQLEGPSRGDRVRVYAEDGSLRAASRWFNASEEMDGLVAADWTYHDEFGRLGRRLSPAPVEVREPEDARYVQEFWLYEPGLTRYVDPLGVEERTVFSSTRSESRRAGQFRGAREYDERGNVVLEVDAAGVETILERDGFGRMQLEYVDDTVELHDGSLRVLVDAYEWTPAGRPLSETSADGSRTTWIYDDVGRQTTEVFQPAGGDSVIVEGRSYFDFDGSEGSRRVVTTDRHGNRTVEVLDGLGRAYAITRPDGLTEEMHRDAHGRPSRLIDVHGLATVFRYDALGRLIRETREGFDEVYRYNGAGDRIARIDRDEVTVLRTFTWNGQLARVERGRWTIAENRFRDDGLRSAQWADGYWTAYAYDLLGRVTAECRGWDMADDSCAQTVLRTYTPRDRLATESRGGLAPTSFEYNALGWLRRQVNPDRTVEAWGHDALGRVLWHEDEESVLSEWQYDAWGRMTLEDLPGRAARRWEYADALPGGFREIRRIEPDGGVWFTRLDFAGREVLTRRPDGSRRESRYHGDRLVEIRWLGAAAPPLARQVLGYDLLGRVNSRWGPVHERRFLETGGVPGPDDYVLRYETSPAGRPLAVEGPNDRTEFVWVDGEKVRERVLGVRDHRFTYDDDFPRLRSVEVLPEGAEAPRRVTEYSYFRGIWLESEILTNSSQTIERKYTNRDAYGTPRLVESTVDGGSLTRHVRETDVRGRIRIQRSIIGGVSLGEVEWTYYGNGFVRSIETSWAGSVHYDRGLPEFELSRIRDEASNTLADFVSRDGLGRSLEVQYAGGGEVESSYDRMGRLRTRRVETSTGQWQEFENRYSARGRLRERVRRDAASTRLDRFHYIEPGWLTEVIHDVGGATERRTTFRYDAAGNRSFRRSGPLVHELKYAFGNRLESVTRNGATTEVTWNDTGGVTVDQRGFRYSRDASGRVEAVHGPGGEERAAFHRDAGGKPVRIELAGELLRDQVWSPLGGTWPLAGQESTGESILWVLGEDGLLGRLVDGKFVPDAVDRSRSTILSGNELDEVRSPFGEQVQIEEGEKNRYRYSGLETVPGLPVHVARQRLYDPEVGRFLSADPLGLDGGDHRFTYAGNNPLAAFDPAGLQAIGLDMTNSFSIFSNGITRYSPVGTRASMALAAGLFSSFMPVPGDGGGWIPVNYLFGRKKFKKNVKSEGTVALDGKLSKRQYRWVNKWANIEELDVGGGKTVTIIQYRKRRTVSSPRYRGGNGLVLSSNSSPNPRPTFEPRNEPWLEPIAPPEPPPTPATREPPPTFATRRTIERDEIVDLQTSDSNRIDVNEDYLYPETSYNPDERLAEPSTSETGLDFLISWVLPQGISDTILFVEDYGDTNEDIKYMERLRDHVYSDNPHMQAKLQEQIDELYKDLERETNQEIESE